MKSLTEKLSLPFAPWDVKWRVGKVSANGNGLAMAYIDARDVMRRLDEACGMDGWMCRHYAVGDKTACDLQIRTDRGWISKTDGAGDTDYEGAKGSFSDSLKRAAVLFGVGRYLYEIKGTWTAVEQKGSSHIFTKDSVRRLHNIAEEIWWIGPLGKTALKESARVLDKALADVGSLEQLSDIILGYEELVRQLEHDLPDWHTSYQRRKQSREEELL